MSSNKSHKFFTLNRVIGILLSFFICLVVAWGVALFASFLYSINPNDPMSAIATSLFTFPNYVLANPFGIAFSIFGVQIACLIAFCLPAFFIVSSLSQGMKLSNEDTGNEHGSDRLATEKEMGVLVDKKHPFNNIMFSEHCGIVFEAYNKKTKDQQQALNFNTITLGISGLGKTFNIVKPDLMASIGNALEPLPYGFRNIPIHFKNTNVYRFLVFIYRLFVELPPIKFISNKIRNYFHAFCNKARNLIRGFIAKHSGGLGRISILRKRIIRLQSSTIDPDAYIKSAVATFSDSYSEYESSADSNKENDNVVKKTIEEPSEAVAVKEVSQENKSEDKQEQVKEKSVALAKSKANTTEISSEVTKNSETIENNSSDNDSANEESPKKSDTLVDKNKNTNLSDEEIQKLFSEAHSHSESKSRKDLVDNSDIYSKRYQTKLLINQAQKYFSSNFTNAFGSKEERASRRKKAVDSIGAGFDVVNSDPKGDNVRDTGHMFVDAGYDLKVFNTIDFREGNHYNPLAYIRSEMVDSKKPSAIECDLSVKSITNEGRVVTKKIDKKAEKITLDNSPELSLSQSCCIKASLNLDTIRNDYDGISTTDLTVDEIDEQIEVLNEHLGELVNPRTGDVFKSKKNQFDRLYSELETLRKQRDFKFIETEGGAFVTRGVDEEGKEISIGHKGKGLKKVSEVIKNFSASHSQGELTLTVTNLRAQPNNAMITLELDNSLAIDGYLFEFPGYTEPEQKEIKRNRSITDPGIKVEKDKSGKATGKVTIFTPELPACEAGLMPVGVVILKVHIIPMMVANGVDLTKTVDTLVANLRGTDAASNNSSDPFWEDTKRLCFMSLVAFLFEKYDVKHRTIPEMMRLLNMALDESGDPHAKSPLSVLMEAWEYGRIFEDDGEKRLNNSRVSTRGGRWVKTDNIPHSRNDSLALHCYHAFMSGADETVQSVIISCQAALVNLISDDVKEMLSYDEMALDTLGDPDQKQIIFVVTKDTNSPFDFLTALIIFQAIDLCQDKAYKKYGGKLPRHVRFILDEVANLGKIPILVRALAVVRSRNISISLFLQSKAQLALVYGEKEADVIFDNCSTLLFLGAQTKETLEEISTKVGEETVYSRTFTRSFGDGVMTKNRSENIQANARKVMTVTDLARMSKGKMLVFIFNQRAALDTKIQTLKHPYYAYIDPGKRRWLQAPSVYDDRFDYVKYKAKKLRRKKAA